jgi:hypothetical protein
VLDLTRPRTTQSRHEDVTLKPIAITSDGARVLATRDGEVCVFEHGRLAWSAPVHPASRIALVGDQVWIAVPEHTELQRFDLSTGVMSSLPVGRPLAPGRWAVSPLTASAVWNDGAPLAIRGDTITPLAPAADAAAPIVDGRWLLWRAGHAALRRPSGEVWRVHVEDIAATLVDAVPLLDGRMIAMWIAGRTGEEQRVIVVGARDGGTLTSLRVTGARSLRFAGRRGAALLDLGSRVTLVDLRFGRVLRECGVPAGLDELVVDDALQYVVIRDGDRLMGARADDTLRAPAEDVESTIDGNGPDGGGGGGREGEREGERVHVHEHEHEHVHEHDHVHDHVHVHVQGQGQGHEQGHEQGHVQKDHEPLEAPRRRPRATPPGWDGATVADAPPPPEPLPDGPLLGLEPLPDWPRAGTLEARRALDARLDLLGARVWLNIAEAWNSGRIVQPDPAEPPFAASPPPG